MGILDFFRKKKKSRKEPYDTRMNVYSNLGTFDVHFKRRNRREKNEIISVKDVPVARAQDFLLLFFRRWTGEIKL